VLAAIGAVAINTTLAVLLVGPLGLSGIALAIAVAAWLEAIALIVVLRARLPHLRLGGLGRVTIEAVAGSVVAGLIAVGVVVLSGQVLGGAPSRPALIVESVVVSLAFGIAFAAVSLVLRIPELASIVEVMVDVSRRPFRR
jgi:putative peptidoglycan lipid II flippase